MLRKSAIPKILSNSRYFSLEFCRLVSRSIIRAKSLLKQRHYHNTVTKMCESLSSDLSISDSKSDVSINLSFLKKYHRDIEIRNDFTWKS